MEVGESPVVALARDDIAATDAIAALKRESEAPGGAAAGTGLRRALVGSFLAARSGLPAVDRDILRLCARRLRGGLQRHLTAIAVLTAVAPLLGLLGTVLGMIETFDVIAAFGTGNARAMAGGISVALITTQTGLLVAIPGFLAGGVLRRRARRLTTSLDELETVLDRQVAAAGATP